MSVSHHFEGASFVKALYLMPFKCTDQVILGSNVTLRNVCLVTNESFALCRYKFWYSNFRFCVDNMNLHFFGENCKPTVSLQV